MHPIKRTLRTALVALIASAALATQAQPRFPASPVHLVVGTPAGGTTDVIARLLATKLSQLLGQPVVVENRTGASGLIAAEGIAKAQPDGYALLMASSQLATYRALYTATALKPDKDLEPLGLVATSPYVLVVHPSLPVRTYAELIAWAKANPGKLSYAGSSPGTAQHLSWELIKRRSGTDMQYVPYKGTSALISDLLSGRLQAGIDNVAILTPYIRSGQLRGIAVTGSSRSALLPDLPTIAATGFPDFQAMGWFGVFATAKTPPATVETLRSAVRSAMESPEVREKLASIGAEAKSGDSGELQALLDRESKTWGKVIKDSHITLE